LADWAPFFGLLPFLNRRLTYIVQVTNTISSHHSRPAAPTVHPVHAAATFGQLSASRLSGPAQVLALLLQFNTRQALSRLFSRLVLVSELNTPIIILPAGARVNAQVERLECIAAPVEPPPVEWCVIVFESAQRLHFTTTSLAEPLTR
jgi:hypothetical protein